MLEERKLNFTQDAVPFMEPQCAIPALASPSEAALVSLAISMKRIADAMEAQEAARLKHVEFMRRKYGA